MGYSVHHISPIALQYLAYRPQLASSRFGETGWYSASQGGHARRGKPLVQRERSDGGALSSSNHVWSDLASRYNCIVCMQRKTLGGKECPCSFLPASAEPRFPLSRMGENEAV